MSSQSGHRTQALVLLVLESLVLWGLMNSGELALAPAAGFLGLRWLLEFVGWRPLGQRQVLGLGLSGVALSIVAIVQWRVHPLIVGAWAPFWLLNLLCLVKTEARLHLLRIGIAFLGLVLLCSLTPDFFVAAVMLVFISGACLTLLIPFLPASESRASYFFRLARHMTLLTVLVFVLGLMIYPFLPRPQGGWSQGWGQGASSTVGHADEMRLGNIRKADRDSHRITAVRLFPKDASQAQKILDLGLLRGRVLSVFDGQIWSPEERVGNEQRALKVNRSTEQTTVLREALRSPTLLSLGRTIGVESHVYSRVGVEGEWLAPGSDFKRVSYRVHWEPEPYRDAPQPVHRFVPDNWKAWATDERAVVFGTGAASVEAKMERLKAYFRTGFQAVDPFGDVDLPPLDQDPRVNLLRFLTQTRKGHCQYYAFATGILLRLEGVPTRLVSGFRLSRPGLGGVLSVKEADSHVWVEAWDGQKWRTLDFTPALPRPSFWLDQFDQARDWAEAQWGAWIAENLEGEALQLNFRRWRQSFSGSTWDVGLPQALGVGAVLILVGVGFVIVVFVWGRRNSKSPTYSRQPRWLRILEKRVRRQQRLRPDSFETPLAAARYARLRWDTHLRSDPQVWRSLGDALRRDLSRGPSSETAEMR